MQNTGIFKTLSNPTMTRGIGTFKYYAFGSAINEMQYKSDTGGGYRYGFNTQEKDDEIAGEGNNYTAEFWQYDSRLGRRFNVDPKPNPSMCPYACLGNNPIFFIDIFGDSIKFSRIVENDKGTAGKIIYDWEEQSGLILYLDDKNKLNYLKDNNGNPIISKDENDNLLGSKTMRKTLMKSIDNKRRSVYIESNDKQSTHFGIRNTSMGKERYINISKSEVDLFISNSKNMKNNKTLGYGIVTFHELVHWFKRTDDPSPDNNTAGPTVTFCNKVRKELGYDLRTSYTGFILNDKWYIPFSNEAYQLLRKNKTIENQPHILLPLPPEMIKKPSMLKF